MGFFTFERLKRLLIIETFYFVMFLLFIWSFRGIFILPILNIYYYILSVFGFKINYVKDDSDNIKLPGAPQVF